MSTEEILQKKGWLQKQSWREFSWQVFWELCLEMKLAIKVHRGWWTAVAGTPKYDRGSFQVARNEAARVRKIETGGSPCIGRSGMGSL